MASFTAPKMKPLAPPRGITPGAPSNLSTRTHLESLTSGNSRYIQQARSRAQAYANQRGLQNSTMAAAAGEAAAIDRALPIAQQDSGFNQDLARATHGANLEGTLATHGANIQGGLMSHGERLTRGTMSHQQRLEKGLMSHGAGLERGTMRVGAGLERGTMRVGAGLEQDTMRVGAGLEKDVSSHVEGLRRGTMTHADTLDRGNISHRVNEGLRADLAMQDAQQQDILERIHNETIFALQKMDRSQRHRLEQTMIGATQDLQKIAITEMGAINRTQGLTPEQQQGAIRDVEQRTRAHINYLQGVAEVAPTWDPLFQGLPSFDVGLSAAPEPEATAAPTQTEQTRREMDPFDGGP